MALSGSDAERLSDCLKGGGVAVFPTDTVYGLGCDPENESAIRRLYELKGRPADRPAAIMFFRRDLAIETLGELGDLELAAIAALLPGPVTLILPNRDRRFPLAAGPKADSQRLGLRIPLLGAALAALASVQLPLMQSSANLSGGSEAQRLSDVPLSVLAGADLVIDGGELPGVASTVLDLYDYQRTGSWSILREGAMAREAIERALS
jgi:L-threonylcarbamoyladenylate synthase